MSNKFTKLDCLCVDKRSHVKGYIVENKEDMVAEESLEISPEDYINIKDDMVIFLKCKNNKNLIVVNGSTPHFRHENYNCTTEWHLNWQSKFENIEVRKVNENTNKLNIADVLIGNTVIEFQHSQISIDDVDERTKFWKDQDKNVVWVIDCSNNGENTQVKDKLIEIRFENKWKYESFKNQDFFYLDIGKDMIIKIKSSNVKNGVLKILNNEKIQSHLDFENKVKALENNNLLDIEYTDCIEGNIYLNQRCAGSGKTYGIIKLIYESIDEKYNKFKDKKRIIYLSKTHSSKDVIRAELLDHFIKYDDSIEELEVNESKKQNKQHQYIVRLPQVGNIQKNLIIATIDSFNYKIGNEDYEHTHLINNIFDKLVESIINYRISSTTYYGHKIDNDCLIIVDEVQDLSYKYIQALDKLREKTGVDVFLVGDKLQSLYTMDNIFEHRLDEQKFPYGIIYEEEKYPCVRRFKSREYVEFVNSIVKFEDNGLNKIVGIGEETCNTEPHIFELSDIYSGEDKEWNIDIEYIINIVNHEIDDNGRFPEDFLFIFPVMNYNKFADKLYNRVIKYFIDKISTCPKYQKLLIQGKPKGDGTFVKYWTDEDIDSIKKESNIWSGEFAEYHTSQVGKPIDLISSEHKARFVSIHASKGDGRNVVFLLGMTEEKLYNFTNREINLQYESFVNVSVTRQKESLYVGVIPNGDDIHNRFYPDNPKQKTNFKIKSSLDSYDITKKISQEIKLIDYGIDIDSIKPIKINKDLIDNNHHIIRYSVIYYKVLSDLFSSFKPKEDKYKQYEFIFERLKDTRTRSEAYSYDKYYDKLREIKKEGEYKGVFVFVKEYIVPFLQYSGEERCKKNITLKKIMSVLESIRDKLRGYNKTSNIFPYMCPIESVVLYYTLELYIRGQHSNISIKDVYYIFETYEFSGHDEQCKCNSIFGEIKDINDCKIKVHYDQLNVLKKFNEKIIKTITDSCNQGEINIDTLSKEYFFGYKNQQGPGGKVSIRSIYDFIIYSDNVIFNILLIPELNDLNKTEIFTEGLIKCFILANQLEDRNDKNEKNIKYKKFNNKDIKLCVVSLNNEPLIIDIDIEKLNNIRELLKEYVYKYFNRYHKMVIDFCEVHEFKLNIIQKVIKNIDPEKKNDKDNPSFPSYICNWLVNLEQHFDEEECDEILKNKEGKFINGLNRSLRIFIKNFLNASR